jgi:hypothetical protein
MDASRVNQRRSRRVGPLRGAPVQFGADLYQEFAEPWVGKFLALLGPIEARQETLDIDRRHLDNELAAGLYRFGEGRRQWIPARAQHLQAVFSLFALRRCVERRVHIATL